MTFLATLPEDGEPNLADAAWSGRSTAVTPSVAVDISVGESSNNNDTECLRGVLFGRWIRATFCGLSLAVVGDDNDDDDDKMSGTEDNGEYMVVVRLQFQQAASTSKALQSYFRRNCKFGDLLRIHQGTWTEVADDVDTDWKDSRFNVPVDSVEHAQQVVTLERVKYWNISKVQEWHNRYYRQQQRHKIANRQQKKNADKDNPKPEQTETCPHHHSGGLEKRQKGEFVANFLFNLMIHHTRRTGGAANAQDTNSTTTNVTTDESTWSMPQQHVCPESRRAAMQHLNQGTGVLDVAGGSGHVSMALGMMGIQSTIVDPRQSIGKLPSRDRRVWKRLLNKSQRTTQMDESFVGTTSPTTTSISSNGELSNKSVVAPPVNETRTNCYSSNNNDNNIMICQPVLPFRTLRAWFGEPPVGVDTDFRHPDEERIMVCDATNPLLQQGTAIVALHPDEATDAIVDTAVQLRIPFVIVPCCVFCRLFPHRRKPANINKSNSNGNNNNTGGDGEVVSTYSDLLDYLQAKDPSIQRATLPFVGANTVLWSYF